VVTETFLFHVLYECTEQEEVGKDSEDGKFGIYQPLDEYERYKKLSELREKDVRSLTDTDRDVMSKFIYYKTEDDEELEGDVSKIMLTYQPSRDNNEVKYRGAHRWLGG